MLPLKTILIAALLAGQAFGADHSGDWQQGRFHCQDKHGNEWRQNHPCPAGYEHPDQIEDIARELVTKRDNRPSAKDAAERVWADLHLHCTREIERQASVRHRWRDGILRGERFHVHGWVEGSASSIRIYGDLVEFQNRMGVWIPIRYVCDFDVDSRRVERVEVDEGRF